MNKNTIVKGNIIPALLVISTVFIVVIYGILFAISIQFDYARRQTASESALAIAEAGVNYYRWHLAHDPADFTDGTINPGPYEHIYTDPQGAEIGKFSLEITPPEDGSSIVTIESTGWTNELPKVKRKIEARYGKESFSRYSFLTNASSWYGSNITINGRIHSNNGIRMDGTNYSIISSAQETYMCGTETGCFPPSERPGVWGSGGDQGLWQFPVPSIDFNTISFDFANMKEDAEDIGLYLPQTTGSQRGYHIIFQSDGSFRVYRVNSTSNLQGYIPPGSGLGADGQGGCRNRAQLIANETLIGTYDVDDNPIIFIEDTSWVEGTVKGRTTLVSARFPIQANYANIWIPNNLMYTTHNGSDALGLIAQNDIYISKNVPTNFTLEGVLIAQQGRILRHGYLSGCGGPSGAMKNSLTIYGSLISYDKSYWNYTQNGNLVSGFTNRTINYDSNMLFNPPPYFPTSGEYEFISWVEK